MEIATGILTPRVKEVIKKAVFQIIMMGDITLCPPQ